MELAKEGGGEGELGTVRVGEEEDSHWCLRCCTVIRGLERYVDHRRRGCQVGQGGCSCIDFM